MLYQTYKKLVGPLYRIASLLLAVLFFYLVFGHTFLNTARAATISWLNDGWTSRVSINISQTKLKSPVTNFPVYVDLSTLGSVFFASVRTDGSDIRITKSDGITELPFDLVSINTSSKTGELHFKADSISATSATKFYIYYGNNSAVAYSSSSIYGSDSVWSNYNSVYHLENDGTDRTNNVFDLQPNNYPTYGLAKLGKGLDLGVTNTVDGLRKVGETFGFSDSREVFQTSVWIEPQAQPTSGASDYQVIFNRIYAQNPASQIRIDYIYVSPGIYMIQQQNDYVYVNNYVTNLELDNWYKLDIVESTSTASFYVNGHLVSTSTITGSGFNPGFYESEMTIGVERLGENGGFKGKIDEVRNMRGQYRSSDWIAAEYLNQSNPLSFYSVGMSESNCNNSKDKKCDKKLKEKEDKDKDKGKDKGKDRDKEDKDKKGREGEGKDKREN